MALSFAWRGNVDGVATSPVQGLPNMIDMFSLVNKTGGTIGVNVYLISDTYSVCIAPNTTSLDSGEMALFDGGIVLLASEQIKVQSSGSLDYNFTLTGMK